MQQYWELRLLDDATLLGGGEPRSLRARKGLALLGYLALQREHSARRETLATLLWEDADRTHARVSLRQLISTVRKLQEGGPELIEVDTDCVRLSPHVAVDSDRFERFAGGDGPDRQIACEIYRSDLLAGLHLPGAPAFHEWLVVEQTRLRNHLVALLVLSLEEGMAEGGDLNRSLGAALKLLRFDPYNELGHRGLMRVYSRQGRSALAVHQYRSLCALLRRELQVLPETETTQLFEQLMQQRRHPVSKAEAGRPAAGGNVFYLGADLLAARAGAIPAALSEAASDPVPRSRPAAPLGGCGGG
ncbi:AfsR/SARP family transcriptional regulator [Sphingomonas sp. DT-51]|uniref:AfsR/SARP family transcriptional regulator n=1 Tax=Sphingomonas sp. DT-51 TaxID=3396165 RepID=UPI003F1CB084